MPANDLSAKRARLQHCETRTSPPSTNSGCALRVCVTWGRKQQMRWAFVDKYCDEVYAIIDAIDSAEKKRNLDEEKINKFLKTCAPV